MLQSDMKMHDAQAPGPVMHSRGDILMLALMLKHLMPDIRLKLRGRQLCQHEPSWNSSEAKKQSTELPAVVSRPLPHSLPVGPQAAPANFCKNV